MPVSRSTANGGGGGHAPEGEGRFAQGARNLGSRIGRINLEDDLAAGEKRCRRPAQRCQMGPGQNGHALISRAVLVGLEAAIQEMLAAMRASG